MWLLVSRKVPRYFYSLVISTAADSNITWFTNLLLVEVIKFINVGKVISSYSLL